MLLFIVIDRKGCYREIYFPLLGFQEILERTLVFLTISMLLSKMFSDQLNGKMDEINFLIYLRKTEKCFDFTLLSGLSVYVCVSSFFM